MWDRLLFLINRLRERLWVRPLMFCIFSVAAALVARMADGVVAADRLPEVNPDSIETLLSITAASMLVIATLAVASMVSAYASAAGSATPRAFSLLVSDDTSQNALSIFLGAFIFTIVALVALKNGYYERAGNFMLFVLTIAVLAWVVLTFVRWVDWIARLGRIGTTIAKVEEAARAALRQRRLKPALGGVPSTADDEQGNPVYADNIGYVQHVNMAALQGFAEAHDTRVTVAAVPGSFTTPGRPLLYLQASDEIDTAPLHEAFDIGDKRVFDGDPRFGLIALSEIGSRALSPAVNDPGTAVEIVGVFVRLFHALSEPLNDDEKSEPEFDRVAAPMLSGRDLLDDAFRALARDGAGIVEFQIRLQKALCSIASMGNEDLERAAREMSRSSLRRAQQAMAFDADTAAVAAAASWSEQD